MDVMQIALIYQRFFSITFKNNTIPTADLLIELKYQDEFNKFFS